MPECSSHRTWIIGVTGGIGAGKSTVLSLLEQEYGACVIQADLVGHLVMEPGQPCYKAVIEHFGRRFLAEKASVIPEREVSSEISEKEVSFGISEREVSAEILEKKAPYGAQWCREAYAEDCPIDRKKLGRYVFSDPKELQALNAIIHPAVKIWILEKLAEEKDKHTAVCVVEAALLLESEYDRFCDEVWYVYASEQARVQRLIASRGYTEEYARQIFDSQKADEWYRSRVDFTVDNSGSPEETAIQVRRRMKSLTES